MNRLLGKCIDSGKLCRDDILFLLNLHTEADVQRLLKAGDAVRRRYVGDDVQVRALVEFSNVCARSCLSTAAASRPPI